MILEGGINIKRQFLKIAVIWIIVLCLTGCSGQPKEKSPYIDLPVLQGVELYMDQTVYPRDVEEITFFLKNNTGQEFLYGADWRLEMLYKEEWYCVDARMSYSVPSIAYISKPDAVHEITNNFFVYKKPLKEGTYRFVQFEHETETIFFIEFKIQ